MPEGLSAPTGGVSESTAAESTGSEGDAEETPSQETTTVAAPNGAPAAESTPKLIPEADLSKYKSTMDRKVSDLTKRLTDAENRASQTERALLDYRWQTMEQSGDPEQTAAVAAERAEYNSIVQQRAVAEAQAAVAAEREQLNMLAKPIVAMGIMAQLGLPADDQEIFESLVQFPDKASMEAHARMLSKLVSKSKLQERKAAGTDRMDGSGGADPSSTWKKLSPSERIQYAYDHSPKRSKKH